MWFSIHYLRYMVTKRLFLSRIYLKSLTPTWKSREGFAASTQKPITYGNCRGVELQIPYVTTTRIRFALQQKMQGAAAGTFPAQKSEFRGGRKKISSSGRSFSSGREFSASARRWNGRKKFVKWPLFSCCRSLLTGNIFLHCKTKECLVEKPFFKKIVKSF